MFCLMLEIGSENIVKDASKTHAFLLQYHQSRFNAHHRRMTNKNKQSFSLMIMYGKREKENDSGNAIVPSRLEGMRSLRW